jgi:hypothetical protein
MFKYAVLTMIDGGAHSIMLCESRPVNLLRNEDLLLRDVDVSIVDGTADISGMMMFTFTVGRMDKKGVARGKLFTSEEYESMFKMFEPEFLNQHRKLVEVPGLFNLFKAGREMIYLPFGSYPANISKVEPGKFQMLSNRFTILNLTKEKVTCLREPALI